MPPLPLPEIPLILRLRRITTSLGPAWTTMPLVPATKTEATCPPPPSMVMALVMVTAPYPAGSRASISPAGAVLEIAPAKVLQGAVRLHGLASSPTPETQVRVACAFAGATASVIATMPQQSVAMDSSVFLMSISLSRLSRHETSRNGRQHSRRCVLGGAHAPELASHPSRASPRRHGDVAFWKCRVVGPRVSGGSPVQRGPVHEATVLQ